MKIKHRLNTQAEAAEYLFARGWYRLGSDTSRLFGHEDSGTIGTRFIYKLRTGKWRIERV